MTLREHDSGIVPMLGRLWYGRTILARAVILMFAGLALLFVAVIIASYRWEYDNDTPLLQYAGLLMSKYGMVPYRDFFETSMPGVLVMHAAIVRFVGTGNLTFILVGQAFLAVLLAVSWFTLAALDKRVATAFVIWFGVFYLAGGAAMILQRDGVGMLPVVAGLCLVARRVPRSAALRAALIGVVTGLAALIKPHLAVGGAIVLLVDCYLEERPPGRSAARTVATAILWAGLGFALPTGLTMLWLSRHDALGPFIELVTRYLPLHIQQDTFHVFREAPERLKFVIVRGLALGGNWPFIPSLVVGLSLAFSRYFEPRKRRLAIGIAILTLYYAVYPMVTGQFWTYHFAPFMFCLLLLLSLLVSPLLEARRVSALTVFWLVGLGMGVLGTLGKDFRQPVFVANQAGNGLVGRMEKALATVWKPGQTIQPLDWTNGTIHAMLRLDARIGTPFFYDYHFHHHVSNPFIQELRARFIRALTSNKPDFVISSTNHPRVSGVDTDPSFPELDAVLARDYCVVTNDPEFTIYRRCG